MAGFFLLRVYDMAMATYVAVAINFAVASVAWLVRASCPHAPHAGVSSGRRTPAPMPHAAVYFAIALSGFTALGAEVVWTRLLSLMLGATVYTFSIILAVFLVGLGFGSSAGALLARTRPAAARGARMVSAAAAGAIAWAAYMISRSLPYWPINPSLSTDPWITFQFDLMRCIVGRLPRGVPLGRELSAGDRRASPDRARTPAGSSARVYAANTVGAIVGAVVLQRHR